jgi:hypothetical protein
LEGRGWGEYWTHKMCFVFLPTFVCNISHCAKYSARYYHKCVPVSM